MNRCQLRLLFLFIMCSMEAGNHLEFIMRKLWLCIFFCGWLVAKPLLVAVTHPSCGHCQAWEKAWQSSQSQLKDEVDLRPVDITKLDDVSWLSERFPEALRTGTPNFLVVSNEDKPKVYGRFIGFGSWARFESQLSKVLSEIKASD